MSTIIWRCVGKAAVFTASAVVLPALAGTQKLIPANLAFELAGFAMGVLYVILQRPLPKDPHHDQ